jgi:ABC-type transport system involved in cytochrome c biogenesis permease subunit
MAEMSLIWLRIATVLYSVGLLHAILTLVRGREQMFRPALGAFGLAAVFHFVSIVERGIASGRCPIGTTFETLSMCAFLVSALFLFIHWRYRAEGLSAFIFPLVFMMALVGSLAGPVGEWSSPEVRNAWLTAHIAMVMLGYAALVFTAAAALLYLAQERDLKRKKQRTLPFRLPPLATLDELISKSMALGFAFITLAIVLGTVWAFVELKTAWLADPKILISFATWGIYLAMVFFRVTAGWRGRKAALLVVVALGCSAVTWVAHARLGSGTPAP